MVAGKRNRENPRQIWENDITYIRLVRWQQQAEWGRTAINFAETSRQRYNYFGRNVHICWPKRPGRGIGGLEWHHCDIVTMTSQWHHISLYISLLVIYGYIPNPPSPQYWGIGGWYGLLATWRCTGTSPIPQYYPWEVSDYIDSQHASRRCP